MSAEETFARRMRQLRLRRGWSQTTLADKVGERGLKFHFSAIAKMELRGYPSSTSIRRMTLNEAVAIAEVLHVPLTEMLEESPCETCLGAPPAGFTCQTCGAS